MLDFSTACNHRGYIIYIYIFIVEIVLSPRNPRTSFPFLFHSHEFPSSVSVLSILDSIGESRIRKNRIASFAVDRKKIDEDERKRDRGIEAQEEDRFEE